MRCPSLAGSSGPRPTFNLSNLPVYLTSNERDRERLRQCWGVLDCGDCLKSQWHCGWCPLSNTCLPLPLTPAARALPLLSPLAHPTICAFSSERFELRTGGLGCAVSTLTFLTCVVTIFCTLAAILLGWAAVRLGVWVGGVWKARKGGWVQYADGRGEVWVRRGEGWRWRRL
ncbi:hypothetical protein V2W45_1519882 [Cenococcum geophilum]